MNKHYDYIFFIFSLCVIASLFSCCNRSRDTLQKAERIMKTHPDKALSLLRGIKNPGKLSKSNYALLKVQKMDNYFLYTTNNTFWENAVRYFSNTQDSIHVAKSFFYAGRINDKIKQTEQATQLYLKANDWAKGSSDYKCRFLINYHLGNLYYIQNSYKDGITTYREALKYANLLNDYTYMSFSFSKISSGFLGLQRNDSALFYDFKALKIARRYCHDQISTILNQIAYVYEQKKQNLIALKYCDEALTSLEKNNAPFLLYCSKGKIYNNLHQYNSAIYFLNKGLQTNFICTKTSAYLALAKAYKGKNLSDKAFYYMEQFNNYRNAIEQQTRKAAVIQIQTIYKNNNLKEENALLKQKDLQKMQLISLIFFIASLLSFAYFIVYSRRQKLIKKQEEKIRLRKEKIQEFKKFQSDRRMAQQILKEIELREAFYKQLNIISVPGLQDLANNEKRVSNQHIKLTDDDWALIIENTNAVFNNFTQRLKSSYPKINESDIHLCCLVKMQLKQADIANIFNIEKDSVKKQKMRIRRDKMCLDGNTLDEVLHYF